MKTFNINYSGKDYQHTDKTLMRALPSILANMTPTDEFKVSLAQKVVETDKSVVVPIIGKVTG